MGVAGGRCAVCLQKVENGNGFYLLGSQGREDAGLTAGLEGGRKGAIIHQK